jgi:hypothetical protein
MLAKATKSVSEIIDKFQGREYTCEYKYDGERAQVWPSLMGMSYLYILPMLIPSNTKIWNEDPLHGGWNSRDL